MSIINSFLFAIIDMPIVCAHYSHCVSAHMQNLPGRDCHLGTLRSSLCRGPYDHGYSTDAKRTVLRRALIDDPTISSSFNITYLRFIATDSLLDYTPPPPTTTMHLVQNYYITTCVAVLRAHTSSTQITVTLLFSIIS